jgi:AAA domain
MDDRKPPEPETNEPPKSWSEIIPDSVITDSNLAEKELKAREAIVDPFWYKRDLGFIFAPRGVGKTWLIMYLAKCLALGKNCGPWKITRPFRVLLIDGEMPLASTKSRAIALGPPTPSLSYLSHETVYEQFGKEMNVCDVVFQDALFHYCVKSKCEVVLMDNLSSLALGYDENDNAAWEQISSFMNRLKRNDISPVFAHHAGRDPFVMRGGSKREDLSGWIIRLEEEDMDYGKEGAAFKSVFTKSRNSPSRPNSQIWKFIKNGEGKTTIEVDESEDTEFYELVASGMTTNHEICKAMGKKSPWVSRRAERGVKAGWMKIEDGKYIFIPPEKRTQYRPKTD